MNRRDALLAVLCSPAAISEAIVQEKTDQNSGTLGTRLVLSLADEEQSLEYGGIFELEVHYQGLTQAFSAREIWDALVPSRPTPSQVPGPTREDKDAR